MSIYMQSKIQSKICFSKQIFYWKQSLGAPDICYRPQETTQIVSASMLVKLKSSRHFINHGGKDWLRIASVAGN